MSLAVGTRLGVYEVLSPIGTGGMGEVYRARDTRLKRDVAIKILPDSFASDPERVARFQREAEVLASLNHSHIAQIYGVEDRALILELVDGPTLADRIAKGPIPIDEALPIARQIAEALEAAHERGIVHRDLKPANIKLTPDGTVKVLDFGLAKALEPTSGSGLSALGQPGAGQSHVQLSQSPTITSPVLATHGGMILGTAAYMSPEQARGRPVDKRADLWAFGCIFFEMLTGQRAFDGEDVTDLLANVLRTEPNWDLLPRDLGDAIPRLLKGCLEKDKQQRVGDAAVIRFALADATARSSAASTAGKRPRRLMAAALAAVAALAAIVAAAMYSTGRPRSSVQPVVAFGIQPPGTSFLEDLALSPTGQRLVTSVFSSTNVRTLWVRQIDSTSWTMLRGTEGGRVPFWSPSGEEIAFYADGKLKKLRIGDSNVQVLCETKGAPRGGSWGAAGEILLTHQSGAPLYRVSANGGIPRAATALDASRQESAHFWPKFLPDGRRFLFFSRTNSLETTGVYLASLDGTERTLIMKSATAVEFAPPDTLMFLKGRTLMAQHLDLEKATLVGDPAPLAEPVASEEGTRALGASASSTVLAHVDRQGWVTTQLTWFNRTGEVIQRVGKPGEYELPAVSPDGTRVAVTRNDPQLDTSDVWVIDARSNGATRLTFDPASDGNAIWAPDGMSLVFTSMRGGSQDFYEKRFDGKPETLLLKNPSMANLTSWSGSSLIFQMVDPGRAETARDLFVLRVRGGKQATPFAPTPSSQEQAQIAPDGEWVAYSSNETGINQIYVRSFPNPGAAVLISTNGGRDPKWRRDGKELFYVSPDNVVMSAAVKTGSVFTSSTPKPLFKANIAGPGGGNPSHYDVTPDGQRFIVDEVVDEHERPTVTVEVNWPARLARTR